MLNEIYDPYPVPLWYSNYIDNNINNNTSNHLNSTTINEYQLMLYTKLLDQIYKELKYNHQLDQDHHHYIQVNHTDDLSFLYSTNEDLIISLDCLFNNNNNNTSLISCIDIKYNNHNTIVVNQLKEKNTCLEISNHNHQLLQYLNKVYNIYLNKNNLNQAKNMFDTIFAMNIYNFIEDNSGN